MNLVLHREQKLLNDGNNQQMFFSPFFTMEVGKRRAWKEVKILPLWHSSSEEMSESIATSGFVHFGKISLMDSTSENTNEVFFWQWYLFYK